MIGKTISHYEILELIGKGGMGEVYRARDTKLGRDVAVKVLSEEFSRDRERLARFEREAKVLAALNHPNIASIYGVEESEGVQALVLELVDGPTLADRIAEGPISIEEAAAIAKQITEALEAAHERGIVHRDLKPANVKVRNDGTDKVLDFGLAKALEGDRTDADGAAAELSEIVLQRFNPDADAPSNESPLQVSRGGGTKPFWSSDGRTLYFAGGDRLMAASISTTPDLAATRPAEVLSLGQDVLEPHGIGIVEVFGQDRDGRFLAIAFPPITSVTQLEAIFHWQP